MARTLAAVPEDGGVLPLYLLSWIQSNLMWSDSELITREELEDLPTAHEHLNNYDLLSRARLVKLRNLLLNMKYFMINHFM